MIIAEVISFGSSFLLPQSLPPLRIFNQFGGYFFEGAAHLKRYKILIVVLSAVFLVSLVTQFPMMTQNDSSYIGGYWISHTPAEVTAMQYLSINAPPFTRVIIDLRCSSVLEGLAPASKHLAVTAGSAAFQVYNTSSTEQAWEYCVNSSVNYVFVSQFYSVIADFSVYSGAAGFSETQLSKFSAPYFSVFYTSADSQVCVYLVNSRAAVNAISNASATLK